jgi:hypothetical protein
VLALAVPAALIVPAADAGAEGIAWAFTAGQLAFAGYAQWKARDLVPAAAWPKLLAPAAATAAATLVALAVDAVGDGGTPWLWTSLVAFGATYAGVLLAIDPWARRNIGPLLRLKAPQAA